MLYQSYFINTFQTCFVLVPIVYITKGNKFLSCLGTDTMVITINTIYDIIMEYFIS